MQRQKCLKQPLNAYVFQKAKLETISENLPYAVGVGTTVPIFKQSKILASSHSFEYIGAGVTIGDALPHKGGLVIQDNEIGGVGDDIFYKAQHEDATDESQESYLEMVDMLSGQYEAFDDLR